jgi:guanine deaminase
MPVGASNSERLMSQTIALALENVRSGKGGPFAALVVKEGKILGEGTNLVTLMNDPTAHAEILAIRAACKKIASFELTGCEIYATCEPCPMCLGAIYWARLARIYFAANSADAAHAGFDDSLIYAEVNKPATTRKIPMAQLLREDALNVFRAWEQKPNKITY